MDHHHTLSHQPCVMAQMTAAPETARDWGPGADPGFLKGGWLILIGHQSIRSLGLNCLRVHLRAPLRQNMRNVFYRHYKVWIMDSLNDR